MGSSKRQNLGDEGSLQDLPLFTFGSSGIIFFWDARTCTFAWSYGQICSWGYVVGSNICLYEGVLDWDSGDLVLVVVLARSQTLDDLKQVPVPPLGINFLRQNQGAKLIFKALSMFYFLCNSVYVSVFL